MREAIKQFVEICAATLPIPDPVDEFGSLLVPGQEGFADPSATHSLHGATLKAWGTKYPRCALRASGSSRVETGSVLLPLVTVVDWLSARHVCVRECAKQDLSSQPLEPVGEGVARSVGEHNPCGAPVAVLVKDGPCLGPRAVHTRSARSSTVAGRLTDSRAVKVSGWGA